MDSAVIAIAVTELYMTTFPAGYQVLIRLSQDFNLLTIIHRDSPSSDAVRGKSLKPYEPI